MFKTKGLVAAALISAAPLVVAEELSNTGEFIDGVAAIVNEGVVLKSQYYEELETITRQAQSANIPLPPANILQEQVLERVILIEIQVQRADRMQIRISDAMLNQVLANVAINIGGPDATIADLPGLLESQGMNYPTFREQMRRDVMLEQLRRIDVDRDIIVSEREIELCIEDLEDNVVVNSEYNLSHIRFQIAPTLSAAEIEELMTSADALVARARDGANFGELAARFSHHEDALQGGLIGWKKGEEVPTIFTEILTDMRAGDISDPYRSKNSIHIVKVNDMRGALQRSTIDQILVRHVLVSPNEIIDNATAKQLAGEAYERITGGEDFGEVAKLMSDDPGSANEGGELGWAGPGTFVPEFEAVASSLEVGETSEPFESPFGWHVMQLMDKRVYDNTEDLKAQNCANRIVAGKREEETQLWLQRIRDEAFVEIRM